MPNSPANSSANLAELLRTAIAESDESLNALAKRAGVDYGNLHRFVNREREQVTLAVAGKLFEALGIVVHRPPVGRSDDSGQATA